MSGIFSFFTTLLAKIAGFAKWFLDVFLQIFKDIWNLITDAFVWVFDSLLGIASGALAAISIPFDPQMYYAMIPQETAQLMGYIGVPQAISMIVAALIVRFALQTIPFVRWGS